MPPKRLSFLFALFVSSAFAAVPLQAVRAETSYAGLDTSLSIAPDFGAPPARVRALLATALPLSGAEASDLLVTLAVTLRDVRYRWGGRSPATGFDCSGFVRYVFRTALGVTLPRSSHAQFRDGERIARANLRPGDLVFFHTRGRRISHVGIYLDGGRFIHAPARGEHVRVDDLSNPYWAHHFAGARRPEALAQG